MIKEEEPGKTKKMTMSRNRLIDFFVFPGSSSLITTSCELEGPFLTLAGELQGCRFPARRAADTDPAPRFPRGGRLWLILPLSPWRVRTSSWWLLLLLVLRPLVVGGPPAQNPLWSL